MRRMFRISIWIIIVWTITCCLFLVISFPDVFNMQTTESRKTVLNNIISDNSNKQDITTKTDIYNVGIFRHNASYLRKVPRFPLGDVNLVVMNVTTVGNSDQENRAKDIRLRREENERRYYTLRETKVNPIRAKFIINGANICNTDANYMTILIIVPSIPSHFFVRDTIRSTYGTYVKKSIQLDHVNQEVNVSVRLVFLVGKDNTTDSDAIVRNESRIHGDIVYADFIESYRNLTRKMLISLNWISLYCSDIDFMLKVDEDVFVNIPKLARELHKRPFDIHGAVYGYLYRGSPVRRHGKWAVPRDEFPLDLYPTYAAGNSYVISGNIIPRLFSAAEHIPYMSIEDAFITGCLARIIDAKRVHIPGFTHWDSVEPDPCKFIRDRGISVTKVTSLKMEKLWKASSDYKNYCDWRNLNRQS